MAMQISVPGSRKGQIGSAGGARDLSAIAGGPEFLDEEFGPHGVRGHHRHHDFVPCAEGSLNHRLDQPARDQFFGSAFRDDAQVIGTDALTDALTGPQELESAERQPMTIPVPAPQEWCQPHESSAFLKNAEAKLTLLQ